MRCQMSHQAKARIHVSRPVPVGRPDVWSDASPAEQTFLFLVHSAFLLFLVVVLCTALDPHLLFLELNFWPLLAVLLAILCVWILLIRGLVDSTRRR